MSGALESRRAIVRADSPRLTIRQSDHAAITALVSHELEHIRWSDLHRLLGDHREERLQIERHRPHRVRPSPAGDELQVPVNQRSPSAKRVSPALVEDRIKHGNIVINPSSTIQLRYTGI